jgi:hypothetical protein
MAKRKGGAPPRKGTQQPGHNTSWRHADADAGAEPDATLEVETEPRRDPDSTGAGRKKPG